MKYIVNEIMSLLQKMEASELDPDFCAYMLINSGMTLSLTNNDGDISKVDLVINYAKKALIATMEELEEEDEIDGTVH
jgi:hypothetical protein